MGILINILIIYTNLFLERERKKKRINNKTWQI